MAGKRVMNENKGIVWLYTVITTVIAVIATVFYTILEKYYIEAETGMYKVGVLTPEAFTIFIVMAVLVLVASMFLFDKDYMKKDIRGIPVLTSIVAIAVAVILGGSGVFSLISNKISFLGGSTQIVYKIRNIGSYVAFPAALYYLAVAFSGNKKSKFLSVMSFFPLVWSWIYLLGIYFDHSAEMSSPVRIMTELSIIFLLLYQLMETRTLVGKAKPVIYLFISGLSLIFLCPAFIPNVIIWAKGTRDINIESAYVLYGGAMAVYIFTRMVGYAISFSTKPKKERKKRKNDIFDEEDELGTEEVADIAVTEFIEKVKKEVSDDLQMRMSETTEYVIEGAEEAEDEADETMDTVVYDTTVVSENEEESEENEEYEQISFFEENDEENIEENIEENDEEI